MQREYPETFLKKNSYSFVETQSKMNQFETMSQFINQFGQPAFLSFLAGYVIGDINMNTMRKQSSMIIKTLLDCHELIRQRIVQRKNILESVIQSLHYAKQKSQQNKKPFKSVPVNMINKNNQHNNTQQLTFQTFLQSFQTNLNQLALDNNYIQNFWLRQKQNKIAEEKQKIYIKNIIQKEQRQINQKYKKERMMMEQENQKLLKKMLEEEKIIHENQIKQLQEKNLECQICLSNIELYDIGLLECAHSFHRACIFEHIKANINQSNVNIACPMQKCKHILTFHDINQYIDGQLLLKYDKFSLNRYVQLNNSDTSWCPTAGCQVIFQSDQYLDNFRCPSCKKHYCLKCKCDYHNRMTCAQYRINNSYSQDDKKFQGFVRGAKYKQCPKCKFWVERREGCSTMTCRCGQEFCYDCGGTGCPHGRCTGSGKKK